MQRVPERRRRVGTVASYYSEYFPRTTYHISFFSPGSISFLLYFSFCFARVFPSGDTDARPVCRPNPFPLGTPSPHCGATSAGRYPPAVAHISAPLRLAPNPPRLGAGAPKDCIYLLAVLPARLACADARFEHFAFGRATALFPRGGQSSQRSLFPRSCLFRYLPIPEIL